MALFNIPDIRLFWSEDPRFTEQFSPNIPLGNSIEFVAYSKFPKIERDTSFWIGQESFHENKFYEIVREIAGDLVENVSVVDKFVHPKTNRTSFCFRITYRSMERNLTSEEINNIHQQIRQRIHEHPGVELR